jgi:hypothetical protein
MAAVLLAALPAAAQEAKDASEPKGKDESVATYERKSITYLETLDAAGAEPEVYDAVVAAVRRNVELPRFDYNDVSRFRSLTPAEAARLVKEYLDKIKLERAKEQAAFDVRFKDFTITGDDLRRIARSAYLYQPEITRGRTYKERYTVYRNGMAMTVERWVAEVGVRVTFYAVDFASGKADVMADLRASGRGSATVGLSPSPRRDAINEAAASAGAELNKLVRSVDAFNLLTPIATAGLNSVTFALSKKEGLKLDQGFYVYEYLTTGGRERMGYVKVTRVGDGEKVADSEAQNITVSGGLRFDEGQLLQEHPQIGWAIRPEFGLKRFSLHAGDGIGMHSASAGGFGGVTAAYDIAEEVGIPEVHATATLSGMIANFAELGLEVGLEKKFYFRRLAVSPAVRVGLLRDWFSFDPNGKAFEKLGNPGDVAAMQGSSVGVTPRLGLEVFLTPEWALTAYGAYRAYTPQSSASLSNTDTGNSYDFDFAYRPSGLEAGAGVAFTF